MKNRRNYYRILHVQPDAPAEVIRSSYRTIMQRLRIHPDLGGDHETAALVNEAYRVLTDPESRAQYDADLQPSAGSRHPRSGAARRAATEERRAKTKATSEPEASAPPPARECPFCRLELASAFRIEAMSICPQCESPLYPASNPILERGAQRAIKRLGRRWTVVLQTRSAPSVRHTAHTSNVSLTGMQLISPVALPKGEQLRLTSRTLDAVGTVISVRRNPNSPEQTWQIGVQFVTLRFHSTQGSFVSGVA